MALGFAPFRDNRRLMNEAIPIDNATDIFVKDLLKLPRSCCRNNEGPEYQAGGPC